MTDIIVKDIKNGSEYYYGWSAEVSAEDVSYDNTTSGMTADNVQDALDEVFQSVSNGKELIADAITDKGVSTSATDSFQTMATNIENLTVWGKYTSNSQWDVLYYAPRWLRDSYSPYWEVTDVQVEDWDNIYYWIFYFRLNEYLQYCCIKYNQTKEKLYSYRWSFNNTYNSYRLTFMRDDNTGTVCVVDNRLRRTVWYFDNNVFVEGTIPWGWTRTAITGTQYDDVASAAHDKYLWARMWDKLITAWMTKPTSSSLDYASITVVTYF